MTDKFNDRQISETVKGVIRRGATTGIRAARRAMPLVDLIS
jgi:hypothetical protein